MSGETTVHIAGQCGFCGYWHGPVCPNIEEIEYFPDGRVKRFRLRSIQLGKPETITTADYTVTISEPAASSALLAQLAAAREVVEEARSMWEEGYWDKAKVRAALAAYEEALR